MAERGWRLLWLVDRVVRRRLPFFQALVDGSGWLASVAFATWARYDFTARPVNWAGVVLVGLTGASCQLVFGAMVGLYRRRYHYGSLDEMQAVAAAVAGAMLGVVLAAQVGEGELVPRSVPLLSAPIAFVIIAAVRLAHRSIQNRVLTPATSEPVVVLGIGEGGTQLIRTMMRNQRSPYRPVAALDDDPTKQNLRVRGVRVEGRIADLVDVAARHGVRTVIAAVPSASGIVLREMIAPALDAGIAVLTLPPVEERLGVLTVRDLRPVSESDLLGRLPAAIDADSIAGYLRGRRVLVTGAGGSIGSELCRQIARYAPATLVMLDRDETGLHSTALSIDRRMRLDSPQLVLADIRDRSRLFEVFATHRPEVVFHAAALKHLLALQHQPDEAWKTNVVGTQHVLDAAHHAGTARLINISTDKAADPISVLGATKRIAERLTADAARDDAETYVSVRFGNVLGSRGSMLSTFNAQIEAGGPVTLTDPEVTRYFMTVQEAVALTIQAGALGRHGEALVLDMGSPVRIADVVRRVIEASGRDVDVVTIGLRDGEKLHEALLGMDEVDDRPHHPLISQVAVPPLSFAEATSAIAGRSISLVTLIDLCTTRPSRTTPL